LANIVNLALDIHPLISKLHAVFTTPIMDAQRVLDIVSNTIRSAIMTQEADGADDTDLDAILHEFGLEGSPEAI
jgi:hypothetical protein